MSLAFHLARKILHGVGDDNSRRVSPPAIRIATLGIAIGLAVMIISVAIIVGFKREIRQKVTSLDAHLQIVAVEDNNTLEVTPLVVIDRLVQTVSAVGGVERIRPFASKLCELKTDSDFLTVGIVGLPDQEGVTLSRDIARRLRLEVGDHAQAFFIAGTGVKSRRLTVSDLYETHFSEYDRHVVLAPLELLQDVSGWADLADDVPVGQASEPPVVCAGLQVFVADFDHVDDVRDALIVALTDQTDPRGTPYRILTAEQLHPQVFGWLALLDTNVWVILILMAVVAAFTTISGLLIIILERTATIGLLKALGAGNALLRRTFLHVAAGLIGRGLLWGNLVGLSLCLVQHLWHPLTLDAENYYLEYVPVDIVWWHVVLLNLGTALLTLAALIAPTAMVAHILPSRALRTE